MNWWKIRFLQRKHLRNARWCCQIHVMSHLRISRIVKTSTFAKVFSLKSFPLEELHVSRPGNKDTCTLESSVCSHSNTFSPSVAGCCRFSLVCCQSISLL